MATTHVDSPHKAMWSALFVAFVASVVAIAVLVPLLSHATGPADTTKTNPALPVPTDSDRASPGCAATDLMEPGEYESVPRTGSVHAAWVIIPDSYEQIAPAPLYVLRVADFTGRDGELDLLRSTFEALDGVVVVTGIAGTGDEPTALVEEVKRDFCIDEDRVVTSILPALGTPTRPGPEPEVPGREAAAV